MLREDPGPCIVCGAPHTACTDTGGPIVVVQLPNRDAITAAEAITPGPLRSEALPLGPGEFSTATYRGAGRKGPGGH